jgi:hypothetical protein
MQPVPPLHFKSEQILFIQRIKDSDIDFHFRSWETGSFPPVELNLESLFLIFSSLDDAQSLAKASAVCRSWCRAARDDRLWMWLFMRAVPAMPRPAAMPASWRLAMLERLRVGANFARRRFIAARLAGHRCAPAPAPFLRRR